ncbi:MAG TPA: hypothetical protein VFZ21_30340 [Gemmatimonadaceae bacterium]|nr:hypothetical protein [Gemmatimonadaceae bacterium]
MAINLLEKARRNLLPFVEGSGVRLASSTGSRWTFETVDLERGDLRIRMLKERGLIEVLFGSAVDPQEWFNAAEVLEHLRYPAAAMASADADVVVGWLREFLERDIAVVTALFSRDAYARTKQALMEIRRVANERLAPATKGSRQGRSAP